VLTDADDIRAVDSLLDAIAAGREVPDEPVTDLLRRAVAGLEDVEAPADEVVATWVDALERGTSWADGRRARRLVPILVVGGSLLFGGAAAAANGSLPDPLQDAVHDVVGVLGIEVPEGDDDEGDRPTPTTENDDAEGVDGVGPDGVAPGQGGTVPGTGADGGGSGVGSEGTPPGQGGTVPGTGEEPGGEGVGPDGTPPGQDGTPGSDTPPVTPTTPTPPTRPTPSSTVPTPPSNGGQGQGNGN
jgi:hypothetical protein